ncbi:MAG: glycoside hydrolase N-terminal domain-containing protein, partial [Sphingomonadaceae bacterium]
MMALPRRTPLGRAMLLAFALLATTVHGADLSLHYQRPAPDTAEGWEREALPIGNGRIGAMIFGQLARERLQFNDITLWTGDDQVMGAYQPFGDVYINLPGHEAASGYQRKLDLGDSLHTVSYQHAGVQYRREAFASYPAQVMVVRLSADQAGQYTGSIELADMHQAHIRASGSRLYATGSLAGYVLPSPAGQPAAPPSANGMDYASQVQVLHEGGTLVSDGTRISFTGCDSITLIIGAGTSYVNDAARRFQGAHPLPRVTAQVSAAAARPWAELLAEHEKDFHALFDRVQLDLGQPAPERLALNTDQRIATYTQQGKDPGLEAQFFQYGRYLLISSSRDSLPANLQGLWNNSLTPPWNSDYHTNINIQMNYWPAEPANLAPLVQPFFGF